MKTLTFVALLALAAACSSDTKDDTPVVATTTSTTGAAATTSTTAVAAVRFGSCDEVRSAGKAPIRKGDPGYSAALDRDGDGVACDTTGATVSFAECQKQAEYPGGKYAVEYDNGVCTVQKP